MQIALNLQPGMEKCGHAVTMFDQSMGSLFRNLFEVMGAQFYDALVTIPGCDKNMPGLAAWFELLECQFLGEQHRIRLRYGNDSHEPVHFSEVAANDRPGIQNPQSPKRVSQFRNNRYSYKI